MTPVVIRQRYPALVAVAVAVAGVLTLSGCSAAPALEGTWSASDGSTTKVIQSDGTCSGMYYNNGSVLDIGGPETCALGLRRDDGSFPLVVSQPPNQATYSVRFDGDTMTFESGGRKVVLTKQ